MDNKQLAQPSLMFITPEMARLWLQKNTVNRKLRPSYVDFLVKEIKQGRFTYTGDPIRFDEQGNLIDGQHRLTAVDKANIGINSAVIFGLPPDVFSKLDSGLMRTLADRTALPRPVVQVYTALLDAATAVNGSGHNERKSTSDIQALHSSLGAIALSLMELSRANSPFFAAAPMRAAAVLSVKTGQSREYVFSLHHQLVSRHYRELPNIADVLVRQYGEHPIRLMGKKVGENSNRVMAFLLGMFIYDETNKDKKRISIEKKRAHYLDLCRSVVVNALSLQVPSLAVPGLERRYEQALKDNIKLREILVDKRNVEGRPD